MAVPVINKFTFVQGEDSSLVLFPLRSSDGSTDYIEGITNIETKIQKADATSLVKSFGSHSVACKNPGVIVLNLTAADTELLATSVDIDIEMEITFYSGSFRRIYQFPKALKLRQRMFAQV